MGPRSLERRFDRFRRKGDPAALASVFDATAAEILKVASHLARDPAAAEDLLQRTFLTAIEVAPTWDRSRRLLPWLLGILANHAKEAARRAARSPDPTRLAPHEAEDPVAAASRREEVSAAEQAIDALPDPARSILVLRYRHGLEPAEIALALGLPPATVRSHLHRGIERVRESVPGALVAVYGLVGLGAATRGLAEIRRVVVARATVAGAEIAASLGVGVGVSGLVIGGVLVGKKAIALAAGLLLLLGGTSYVIVARGPGGDDSAQGGPPASLDTERHEPTLASRAGATGRRPTTDSAAVAGVTDPTKGSLEVRVLARDGAAIPDEPFTVLLSGGSGDPEYRFARTGADGRGRLEGLEPGEATVWSGHGPTMEVEIPAGGIARAEIRLPRGLDIEGVVVDLLGSPVVGAEVRIDRVSFRPSGMLAVTRTKADGRFAVQDVFPDATVSARAVGYAPSGRRRLQLGEGKTETVRLVLGGRGASVRGRVEDAGRSPVAGALVTIGDQVSRREDLPDDGTHLTNANPLVMFTADDGTFAAEGLPVGKAWVAVTARGQAPHQMFRDLDLVMGPAPNDWTITLSAGVAIEGVVVDEAGSPVGGAAVWTNSGSRSVTDAQGRFRFDVLASDPAQSMRVFHYVRGKPAFGDAKAGPLGSIVRLVLHPSAEIRVMVVDERGEPISNRNVFAWTPKDLGGSWVQSLTDPDGRATLPVGLQGTYELYVTDPEGEDRQPSARLQGAVPGVDGLTLTVREKDRPTAKIVGRLTVPDGHLPDGAVVSAIPYVASLVRTDRLNLSLDAASGRFESKKIQPGRYEVSLTAVGMGTVPLGQVRIEPGQTRDIGEIRLDPPGSLVVKVLDAGEYARSGFAVRATSARGRVWARTERDGTARYSRLLPGRYDVYLGGWARGEPPSAGVAGSVVIESGREASLELRAPRGHVRTLRVQGLRAEDVPGLTVEVRAEGADVVLPFAQLKEAPRDGVIEYAPALAPGRYVVVAETDDARKASVSFEVRGDGEPPVVLGGFR